MEETTTSIGDFAANSKRFVRRLLTVGENRLELLSVEMQEERERLVRAFLLALVVAIFGLFAGLTFTTAIVVWLWTWSPIIVLLGLTAGYAAASATVYWRLTVLLRQWQTLSATLDQLRKDRVSLEQLLA